MGNGLIAFLAALSLSVWVYNKLMRTTGGNVKNAVIGSFVVALFVFVAVLTITSRLN
jgi:hypothetical protein